MRDVQREYGGVGYSSYQLHMNQSNNIAIQKARMKCTNRDEIPNVMLLSMTSDVVNSSRTSGVDRFWRNRLPF